MSSDGIFNLDETDKLLTTTRAVRKRLDLDREVPREVILKCLDISQQAPTGSNSQGWSWVVIYDQDTKDQLGKLYREGAGSYLEDAVQSFADQGPSQDKRVFSSAHYLAENMENAPALVIPCIDASRMPENAAGTMWAGLMGSIFPAIWSFQLALRSRGLGSALTTLHLRKAQEAQALLGIPDNILQVAMLPVAYTQGQDFKQATRPPVETIVHFNKW